MTIEHIYLGLAIIGIIGVLSVISYEIRNWWSDSMTSTMTDDRDGRKRWRNPQGQFHRTLGPAVEFANGYKEWWVDGQLHRTDGPAIEGADGHKSWWVDGRLHRTDGPAIEGSGGTKAWYLNGQQLTFAEWLDRVTDCEHERTLLLLKYGE
jgi:hypothetical protein